MIIDNLHKIVVNNYDYNYIVIIQIERFDLYYCACISFAKNALLSIRNINDTFVIYTYFSFKIY